ncbi:uncharacterized protein LOC126902682 [Daktulosphaira vitifoliae]|uniref:uncharacterized protein LOC126902682 n=1 Tax=Daktulosphaira vitifoliae TaxID=58002 RepID=UPI0021AAB054|nr:uncharacterized protein LOC126902682 [Daktulosphaira vitifoliae]
MYHNLNLSINMASEYDPAFCPNGCGRSYKGADRKHNLKKHMMYACGVKPKFVCDINGVLNLLNIASRNDPAFCPKGCGHSYKGNDRKRNLKKHIIYACGVSPKFDCIFCSKKFFRKHTLKCHLLTIHRHILK